MNSIENRFFLVIKWEFQVVIPMIMLAHSSGSIFNPMQCTGYYCDICSYVMYLLWCLANERFCFPSKVHVAVCTIEKANNLLNRWCAFVLFLKKNCVTLNKLLKGGNEIWSFCVIILKRYFELLWTGEFNLKLLCYFETFFWVTLNNLLNRWKKIWIYCVILKLFFVLVWTAFWTGEMKFEALVLF